MDIAKMLGISVKPKKTPNKSSSAPLKSLPIVEQPTQDEPTDDKSEVQSDYKLPEEILSLITWKSGQPVPFSFVSSMFEKIEAEPGRNAIVKILCDHFLAILCSTPEDLIPLAFISLGQLRPAREGVKLNIGDEGLHEAVAQATGTHKKAVKQMLLKSGDLGTVASSFKSSQSTMDSMFGLKKKLHTIRGVYTTLLTISKITGQNSQRRRQGKIQELLTSADNSDVKFLTRILMNKLRIGVAESSVLIAIGQAFRMREYYAGAIKHMPEEDDLKHYGKLFKKIFHRYPLIDEVITEYLKGGFERANENNNVKAGVPVMPMLAKPAKSQKEIISRLGDGRLTGEYKYDGERAQIHKDSKGTMHIYSRSAEDSTLKFMDLAELVKSHVQGDDYILDSEVVAYDTQRKLLLPFQTLMHRPKKGSDEPPVIQICVFLFDILYYNGQPLIQKSLSERREVLRSIIVPIEGKIQLATYIDCPLEDMKEFFTEAVSHRTEGLMIKRLDSEYEPGKRSQHWAKLKKDYTNEFGGTADGETTIGDSMDCVVIGAEWGVGKRTDVFGSFLIAVLDEYTQKFQAFTQLGTGFSEQDLIDIKAILEPTIVEKPPKDVQYNKSFKGLYMKPTVVWEVKVADIQKSLEFPASFGEVTENTGLSARFSRYLRSRPDKSVYQCTTSQQLLEFYHQQFQ